MLEKKYKIIIVGILILALLTGCTNNLKNINSIEDLEYSNVGIYSSSEYDKLIESYVSTVNVKYYSSYADQIAALKSGKIDAFLTDEPIYNEIIKETSDLRILEKITEDSYAFAISPNLTDLQKEINMIMEEMETNGILSLFEEKWMGNDESKKNLENYDYEPINGTLTFGTNSTIAPFSYIKNDEVVGYDIDVIKYICYKLGYELKIVEMSFDGIIPAVVSNKVDVAGASIIVTEERKKSVLFSSPDYTGGIVIVVRDE